MDLSRWVAIATTMSLMAYLAPGALAKKKKKGDEELPTQALSVLKDPPGAVAAETRRLTFHTSPLSNKGLLSQQVRDALKSLNRQLEGAAIIHLRAFVAGSGDLRRVQAIVSETFTEKRQALPALTVVQAGGLPMEGAQVLLEAAAVARKEVNPNGLAFISAISYSDPKPLEPLRPLAEKVFADLDNALSAAHSTPADLVEATCYLSSLDHVEAVRKAAGNRYPPDVVHFVQLQRAPSRSRVACDAVARLASAPAKPVVMLSPEGIARTDGQSTVALVNAPRVAMSGIQMAFGFEENDAKLAFERLGKALETAGASMKDAVYTRIFPLDPGVAEKARKVRFGFFDPERPPAGMFLGFEGLPSMDATIGLDVVAVANH